MYVYDRLSPSRSPSSAVSSNPRLLHSQHIYAFCPEYHRQRLSINLALHDVDVLSRLRLDRKPSIGQPPSRLDGVKHIYRGVSPLVEAFVTLERPDIHEPTTTSASAVAVLPITDAASASFSSITNSSSSSPSSLAASSTNAPAARNCACATSATAKFCPAARALTSARSCPVCAALRSEHTRYGESARSGQCEGSVVMTSGASNECTCVAKRFAAAVSAAGEGVVLRDDDDERGWEGTLEKGRYV